VGNIRSFLPSDMTLQDFWNYLKTVLTEGGLIPTSLTPEELAQVKKLQETKYATWQWNYGKSPKSQMQNKCRFPGGLLDLHLTVENGKIAGIQILGDFLALTPVEPLEEALTGCAYREDAIADVLKRFALETMLGNITEEEFIKTVLL
jgi:lipoate-protein ligase A